MVGRTAAPATAIVLLHEALAGVRGGFLAVMLFSLAINLLMLTAPLYMLQVFDRVLSSRSTDTLLYLTLVAGIAFVTMGALEAVRNQVMVRLGVWLDLRLGGTLLSGGITAALRVSGAPSVQGLRDLATFRTFLTGPSIFPIMDAPWTPIFLAVIFLLHPTLGWLAVGGAIALFTIAVANEFATRRLLQQSGGVSIRALRQAEAAVRNADVIEAMGMMGNLVARWNRLNEETVALQARASTRAGRFTALSKFLRMSLQVAVLGVGASLVLKGELTPGAMIAGSILMARALAPVDQAINSWKSAITARTAFRRLKQQLAETPMRDPSMPLPTPKGQVVVKKLGFQYPGAKEAALRNVAFKLEPGEAMGLIGPSAAGKTTLARLLVGNLNPQAGDVRLDGADVAQWDSQDLGRHIGYLPQDIELFGGTVRENIARMGESEPDAVIAAAQRAGMHELVLGLADGYETEIGEGGAVLSGGQRQRIGMARAMFGDPRLVVLDEPSASLDQPGEETLLKAIAALKADGVTVVIIAHRPNILRLVDKILVLNDHTVQMFGPRDEVMAELTGPAPAGVQAAR